MRGITGAGPFMTIKGALDTCHFCILLDSSVRYEHIASWAHQIKCFIKKICYKKIFTHCTTVGMSNSIFIFAWMLTCHTVYVEITSCTVA